MTFMRATGHGTTSMATSRCSLAGRARWPPGDVLIHRAVGSDGNRLIAVGEVRSMPGRVATTAGHGRCGAGSCTCAGT